MALCPAGGGCRHDDRLGGEGGGAGSAGKERSAPAQAWLGQASHRRGLLAAGGASSARLGRGRSDPSARPSRRWLGPCGTASLHGRGLGPQRGSHAQRRALDVDTQPWRTMVAPSA